MDIGEFVVIGGQTDGYTVVSQVKDHLADRSNGNVHLAGNSFGEAADIIQN